MPERAIVKYGIYVFDPDERESYRLRILTQIEQQPTNLSSNFKLQKPRSFYGYAQLMFGQWVYDVKPIEYEQQLLWEFTNDMAQQAILLYCATQAIRDSVIALSGCIPGCNLEPGTGQITGLWRFPATRVVFKLFENTTLLVNTDLQQFYNPCNVELPFGDETYTPPEPSETNVPENPNEPGYDIPTLPYDEPSNDFGETYNPNVGETVGGTVRVTYSIYQTESPLSQQIPDGTIVTQDFTLPGDGYTIELQPGGSAPNFCSEIPQVRTVAIKGSETIVLLQHSTCNRLEIDGYTQL